MSYKIVVAISVLMLVGCAPEHRVLKIEPDTYKITESGGWGFDLRELKDEVKAEAKVFAESAGKKLVIVSETIEPDKTVDVYPAVDDTYTLVFKLVEKNP